jgi:hypothetical protein
MFIDRKARIRFVGCRKRQTASARVALNPTDNTARTMLILMNRIEIARLMGAPSTQRDIRSDLMVLLSPLWFERFLSAIE